MHVEKKRIFVDNLPPYVDENEIKKQFTPYGNVVSVDIKQRKINAQDNVFAFVNVEIDNRNLQQCFRELSNYNWQGYYVKLELAKESFLDRLKREREENQANNSQNNLNNSSKTEQQSIPVTNNIKKQVYHSSSDSEDSNETKPYQNGKITPKKTTKKKESSSSSSSDYDSDEEKSKSTQNNKVTPVKTVAKVSKKKDSSSSSSSDSDSSDEEPKKVIQSHVTPVEEPEDESGIKLVIKSNKHKIIQNGGLKIESVNSTPIHVITNKKGVKNEKKDKKSLEADEKRRQSLAKMKNTYNQQKSAIRNALSRIDTQQSNNTSDTQSKKRKRTDNNDSSAKKQKLSLFNDDNDEAHEEDINFAVKNQFEGRKGQKLLELQSRYTNDKRFALDERFAEDEQEEYEMEGVDDDEKDKQLEILESVLGKKVRKNFKDDSKNSNFPKAMLRFDPSKPEHSKFEIKREIITKKDKRKERKEKLERVEQAPIPEVSKDKFYQVKDNLKESLKENEGFSLLSMFGRAEEKDDEAENQPETSEEIKKNNKFDYNKNPFKYDSSDTEDEGQEKQKKQKQNKEIEPRGVFKWNESFFFEADDGRLKDGLEFLQSVSTSGKNEPFKDKRRAVYRILQGKIKNVERDKRKHERKLRKRIKVKRAKKS